MSSRPVAAWFTGCPGSGKTTIARALAPVLDAATRRYTAILDGDELRAQRRARPDAFSRADRDWSVRVAAEKARAVLDVGGNAVVALVSPYRDARDDAVRLLGPLCLLVHLECPLEVLRERDPKGLYERYERGLVRHVTGLDDPYEPPDAGTCLRLNTSAFSTEHCVARVAYALGRLQSVRQ